MLAHAQAHEPRLDRAAARRVEAILDGLPRAREQPVVDERGDLLAAVRAARQVRFDREGLRFLDVAAHVARQQLGLHVPGHASSSLSCARARIIRVLTVPAGMPSRRPASRVVSPSRTVAWTTARSCGESCRSAPPRSPCSTPSRTSSSARAAVVDLGHEHLAARKAAQRVDQPADRDSPDPGADVALALVAPGAAPDRHERVLDRLVDDAGVGAAAGEAQREPRGMAVVEHAQRRAVAVRDGGQHLDVVALGAHQGPHDLLVVRRA